GLKMSRKIFFCVAVCLILSSVHAAQKTLDSITDLINCPLSENTNILELLYWFAHQVDIDDYVRLTFDPNSDYGSHHYGNYENILDEPLRGQQYYTIGNLNEDKSQSLPSYVRNRQRNIDLNRARIIIRVNVGPQRGQIIHQVYITQHSDEGTFYDPNHTYRITTSLLQEIRRREIYELQQLVSSSQRGNASTRLHGSTVSFTQQSRHNPRTNNNDYELWKNVCFAILFICICIFVLPFLGNMNNRK
ncbi:hypothetical protein ILYODFUR_038510, partial [Ilyodon furcidens]